MALTREILTANAALNGLTDEQLNAIVTLSANDENSVLGTRIGEIYRNMDATIANATGIARNGDEKTYNYLERAAKEIADKAKTADGLQAQIAALTKEKERLEKVIADGNGDTEAKKQLAQAQKDLAAVTKQFTELKTEFDTAKANHEKELFGVRIDNAFAGVTANLQFKPEFPENVTRVIVQQAIAKVKAMNPEFIDDGNGGKVLTFKDANGARLNNPNNGLNPYTAEELVAKELGTMGILADKKQTGGGTKPPHNSGGGDSTIQVQGARTQTEANDIIEKALAAQGLVVGTNEYQTALDAAWKDNNISSLPIQ